MCPSIHSKNLTDMRYLLLEDIKRQCVVEHDEDDALLMQMGAAVEAMIPHALGQNLDDLADENGNLPADLYLAMLMKVGDYYAHRESKTGFALHDTGEMRSLLLHYVRH